VQTLIIQLAKDLYEFPPCLKFILESKQVLKVGNYINWEIKYLKEDWSVTMPEDTCRWINRFAKEKKFTRRANRNLDDLCRIVLRKSCPKDGREVGQEEGPATRLSKWSKDNLSEAQVTYAARDAVASLLIDDAIEARSSFSSLSYDEDLISAGQLNDPLVSPKSPDSPETPVETGKFHQRIILDLMHFFMRPRVGPKHPYSYAFKTRLRDACLIPDPLAKKRMIEKLASRDPPTTFERMLAEDPEYVWKRVPRYTPDPENMYMRVQVVLGEFSKDIYKDSKGVPVLNDGAKEEMKKLLVHIKKGCVSDPPGVQLYQLVFRLFHIFQILKTL
jgi:hypothetical protein